MKYPFNIKQLDPKKKKTILWVSVGLIALTILSLAILSWKINSYTSNHETSLQTSSPTQITLNVIFSLVFVFSLIYAFFYVFRWLQSKKNFVSTKKLVISESIRLSPHQQIAIIQVGNRRFLLGATEQTISMIAELEKEEENPVSEIATEKKPSDFRTVLQQNISNFMNLPKQPE
jgi:flagellar biosynthetic protein FliO